MNTWVDRSPSRLKDRGSVPERKCLGCRKRDAKKRLLRFVVDSRGHLMLDVRQRASGRGLYVCPSRECLQRASAGGAWSKGARRRVTLGDSSALASGSAERVREELKERLGRALRDGRARVFGAGQLGQEQGEVARLAGLAEGDIAVSCARLREELGLLVEQLRGLEAAQ